ncbi:MAG: hypothetical protein II978_06780, partial [Clostridia bacterium]|nr:hypothetical protein [Clostridia bacterium]
TKVWLYAPNYFSGKPEEVSGIKIKEISETTSKVTYNGKEFGFTEPTAPMFEVDEPESEAIACYTDGKVACAQKGNQIYIATGNVPSELWRDIAKKAGVHLYTENPGALYVDSRFIAYQTVHETDIELNIPFDCTVEELFDGGSYKTNKGILKYKAENNETKLFLVKDKMS